MGKVIDVELIRNQLLKQQKEINEKLKALDQLESMADALRINVTDTLSIDDKTELTTNGRFSNLTMVEACRRIFEENPNNEYSIKNIMALLEKEGLQVSVKYGYATISSTLNRLVNRGKLKKIPRGSKMLFQKNNNGVLKH